MSNLALFVVSLRQFDHDEVIEKRLIRKNLLPIGDDPAFLTSESTLACRYQHGSSICTVDSAKLVHDHGHWSIKSEAVANHVEYLRTIATYVLLFASGDTSLSEIIVVGFNDDDVADYDVLHPEATLSIKYAFPPSKAYVFQQSSDCPLPKLLRQELSNDYPALFAVSAQRFLADPHVLTKLFEKVLTLRSHDQIDAVTAIRILSHSLREYLEFAIHRIEKDHQRAWGNVVAERIAFLDGGVSRIGAMPSVDPVGVRAGVYSVVPGETDLDEREDWRLYSSVVGDVLNDRSYFEDQDASPDPKRVQEAARYIIEILSALKYREDAPSQLKYLFLHGPLQNPFQVYDELSPNFVPAIDPTFLSQFSIERDDVVNSVTALPTHNDQQPKWNSPIPVYLYAMLQVIDSDTPIIGVVERARSRSFTYAVLEWLQSSGRMDTGSVVELRKRVERYDIDDEFLFGCVLEEGEYIDLVPVRKNTGRRAHDRWAPVVEQFPLVHCTMLKTSPSSFPFRVEFGSNDSIDLCDVMDLLYHTAALLPRYAFPVGVDIADKYAKIPDWLSAGISMQVATAVMLKAMQTGDANVVQLVRQKLSMTPRDFFYRPGMRP